ncbi:MAG: O-antigen ligase family protein [Hyphomicrobiaceae bacterium]
MSRALFTLTNPGLLFGVALFAANTIGDKVSNLPLADLILPVYCLGLLYRQGTRSATGSLPGLVAAFALLVWIALANDQHGLDAAYQLRRLSSTATIFLPLYTFLWIRDKAALLSVLIGMMLGFALYFLGETAITLVTGGNVRALRWVQPTPVVLLAIPLVTQKQSSWLLRTLFYTSAIISCGIGVMAEARAPLIAVVVAVTLYGLARLFPWPRVVLVGVTFAALIAHCVMGLSANALDTVILENRATASNMERAAAVDYSLAMATANPIWGISQPFYGIDFADYYRALSGSGGELDYVESPHNTILEQAVFYGIPAAVLTLLAIFRLLWAPLASPAVARQLGAAMAVAAVIRLCAFYGISGIYRIEWHIAVALLYYLAARDRASAVSAPAAARTPRQGP